ncbi:Oxysterol-Binding Protein-Related Protein 7 [Manis pentadactyla]|nr:Oxysterol-Binding Protein-Related Protein 7 [Manis pentadactyla]
MAPADVTRPSRQPSNRILEREALQPKEGGDSWVRNSPGQARVARKKALQYTHFPKRVSLCHIPTRHQSLHRLPTVPDYPQHHSFIHSGASELENQQDPQIRNRTNDSDVLDGYHHHVFKILEHSLNGSKANSETLKTHVRAFAFSGLSIFAEEAAPPQLNPKFCVTPFSPTLARVCAATTISSTSGYLHHHRLWVTLFSSPKKVTGSGDTCVRWRTTDQNDVQQSSFQGRGS